MGMIDLPVKHRTLWFNQSHPIGMIDVSNKHKTIWFNESHPLVGITVTPFSIKRSGLTIHIL